MMAGSHNGYFSKSFKQAEHSADNMMEITVANGESRRNQSILGALKVV